MKEELREFYKAYGHSYVSPKENKPLFQWVDKIRTSKNLEQELIGFLNSMGFDWRRFSRFDQHWLFMYHELIDFRKKYGHTKVPLRFKENGKLGVWVSEQRKRKDKLAAWKINLLDKLNFIWELNVEEKRERQWMKMYEQLLEYRARHGHTRVPSNSQEYPQLATWVRHQRELETSMPAQRRERLNQIQFSWHSDIEQLEESRWEEKFIELKAFKEKHGHLKVSSVDPAYYQLTIWIEQQKKQEKTMPAHRKEKLNSINFRWQRSIKAESNRNWNRMYEELVAYYQKFGHCKVPNHSKEYPELSRWVERHRLKWNKLDSRKRKKLEELKFVTSKEIEKEQRQKWLKMLARLKKFKRENGHCRVPSKYKADPPLGRWVEVLRIEEKKLSDWKKKMLDELGFEWSSEIKRKKIKKWYEMYDRLLNFYEKFGHSRVPEYWEEDKQLSIWVSYQRRPKKPLSIDKINLLKQINFDFKPAKNSRKRDDKGRYIPLLTEEMSEV